MDSSATPKDTATSDVNMYRGRSRSRSPPPRREFSSTAGSSRPTTKHPAPQPGRVLGVFGLSFETREADLTGLFEKFGEIESVSIVYDKRTGQSRGFGFVYFKEQSSAERAIPDTNGMNFLGRNIRVDFSATTRPHDPTPGRYMGEVPRRDDRRGGRRRSRSRSRDRYRRRSRDRSRSRSRDRRSYYPPPSYSSSSSRHYRRSPVGYRDRSRTPERHYSSSRRRSPSPRRRSPSPRRHSPGAY